LNSGTQDYLYDLEFVSVDTGWVVGQGGTILKTTDGGTTWIQQSSNTINRLLTIFFIDNQTGWAGGDDGILLKTTDGGNNWQQGNIPLTDHINDLFFLSNEVGCAATDGWYWPYPWAAKIMRTTDAGNFWYTTDGIVGGAGFFDLFVLNTNAWSVGSAIVGRSTNSGENWDVFLDPVTPHWLFGVFFKDSLNGWAVGGGTDTELILKSIDGGISWQIQKLSYQFQTLHGICFTDPQHGWTVGAAGIILKTLNGGINWIQYESPTTNYLRKVQFPEMNIGYAVGANGTILKYQGNLSYITVIDPNGGDTLLVGSSYSISWDSQNINYVKIDYSIDDGLNWINVIDSLTSSGIYEWVVPNNITNQGRVKISDISDPGIFDISDEVFQIDYPVWIDDTHKLYDYNLSQNYPNPFNPSTVISYQSPVIGFVTLKVYDILGREVATLVNEEKPTGEYEVEFNGSNFPSGIYFYQLKTGLFTETRKMVLLR
jgi:photosystem II stability/assembly factor-like uncharacterized protein